LIFKPNLDAFHQIFVSPGIQLKQLFNSIRSEDFQSSAVSQQIASKAVAGLKDMADLRSAFGTAARKHPGSISTLLQSLPQGLARSMAEAAATKSFISAFSSSSSAAENKSLLIEHSNSLPQSQLHENIDSLYNYTKYNIPPPENLIAKSVFISEPIRSGAPFSFV
jgi:hypothetical protein